MKLFLDSIGCRLNISELEHTARAVQAAGWDIVMTAEQADVILINTCTVTAKAAADSRQKIRQAHRVSQAPILVTGCWSTLVPEEALSLPGVTTVIPNEEKDRLIEILLGEPGPDSDRIRHWLKHHQGMRLRTRSFVKVQDGCNNRCTYCITTIARGRSRSRPVEDILADILAAEMEGVNEIVLTGVHLGMWGRDLPSRSSLTTLLHRILLETDIPRIHLSSLEPWDLPSSLLSLWDNPRMVRHLHMPLQSGSAAVLQRMGRHVTPKGFADLLASIRSEVADMAVTTDIIAGFPGESEDEHRASVAFVREMAFAGGHVFPYSERKGTRAAGMDNPVHNALRKERAAELRSVLQISSQHHRMKYIDSVRPVLWVQQRRGVLQGITDNEIKVYADGPADSINRIQAVRLEALEGAGMRGTVHDSPRLSSA